jgi:hypothetical protein
VAAAAAERVQLPAGECFNHRPPRLAALLHPAWLIVLCFQTQSKNKRLTPPQCVDIAPVWDKASKQFHGIINTGALPLTAVYHLLSHSCIGHIIFHLTAALAILSFISQLHLSYYLSSHSCIGQVAS